jgi:hypothetical protein
MSVLGKFVIVYATYAMSRFNLTPSEGNLKAAKIIPAHLKTFPKGRVIFDTEYQIHYFYPIEDHPNWKDFYAFSEE